MIRTFAALALAALVSLAMAPSSAQARDGGAIAAGVLGGLAAGAIIGTAAANARPAPPPPVYYAPPPPAPVVEEDCYYERPRVWDPYAGVWRRGPRRMVCD
jgi:hypothetical protein